VEFPLQSPATTRDRAGGGKPLPYGTNSAVTNRFSGFKSRWTTPSRAPGSVAVYAMNQPSERPGEFLDAGVLRGQAIRRRGRWRPAPVNGRSGAPACSGGRAPARNGRERMGCPVLNCHPDSSSLVDLFHRRGSSELAPKPAQRTTEKTTSGVDPDLFCLIGGHVHPAIERGAARLSGVMLTLQSARAHGFTDTR
jgi:hypothetical protein